MDLSKLIDNDSTPVSLESTGGTRGTAFTPAELGLIRNSVIAGLVLAQQLPEQHAALQNDLPKEVHTACQAAIKAGAHKAGLGSLIRAIHKHVESAKIADAKTEKDFPYVDNKTGKRSCRVYSATYGRLRGALKEFREDIVDTVLPKHGKKDDDSAAA